MHPVTHTHMISNTLVDTHTNSETDGLFHSHSHTHSKSHMPPQTHTPILPTEDSTHTHTHTHTQLNSHISSLMSVT